MTPRGKTNEIHTALLRSPLLSLLVRATSLHADARQAALAQEDGLMAALYTAEEVRQALKDECEYAGGIRAFARLSKISAGHISRILRGEKEPGPRVLDWLQIEAVTLYQPHQQGGNSSD